MTKHFPPIDRNYDFLQVNRGDTRGSLWSSFGLDLQSNPGAIRLGRKLVTNTTSADDGDLGLPSAFEYWAQRWWAVCGTRVFKTADDDPSGAFTEDASTGAATDYVANESDLATFDSRLWASTDDDLLSKASATGTWTSRATLSGGTIHLLLNFRKTHRLYFTDAGVVYSIDANNVVNATDEPYTLVIPDDFGIITCMDESSDSIWIGTMLDTESNSAKVLRWDGVSAQITQEYKIPAAGVLALKVCGDIPYIIDTEGVIRALDATDFKEVARFPLDGQMFRSANGYAIAAVRPIMHSSIDVTKDNTLLIGVNPLINSLATTTLSEKMASGIWELDLSNGNLTHKHAFTNKTLASTSPTDYAQMQIVAIGAVKVNTRESQTANGKTGILAGARVYTDDTSARYAIFTESSIPANEKQKAGRFVTTWFKSDQIDDNWQMAWAVYRRFLNPTDKMVFKYRVEEADPVYATITWVSTTSFTTTTNISAYANGATGFGLEHGGEVEVLRGTGAGACRHITNVSEAMGTYTVTLDYAVTGVTTGTAQARFQKWVKLLPEVSGQVNSYERFPVTVNSPRIQLKGYLEWTGDNEFYKSEIYDTTQTEVQA